jgi:hypothetical protein
MLTALARLLSGAVRLAVIVACSVMAGLAMAFATRNVEGDVLGVFALFATFATPIIVAWWLLRTIPPLCRQATDSLDVRVPFANGNDSHDTNNEQSQSPSARDHLR